MRSLQRVAQLATAVLALSNVVIASSFNLKWQNLQRKPTKASTLDTDPTDLYTTYTIEVPVDHFQDSSRYTPHSNDTFHVRYWFDASYYEEGGPVIILQSGETSGTDRLSYLQKGILHQLINATNGIGVVLEHRYYGESIPTSTLSTKNMRFLTTEQALADEAYFAQNIVFPGLEDKNLTAPNVPYFIYGGSYAGGLAAFTRVEYPDIFWGAIASSGVVEAIYDYWQYYEPIRIYGPSDCIEPIQMITAIGDNILTSGDNDTIALLKDTWGLGDITDNTDFVSLISNDLAYWQDLNWDPSLNYSNFGWYCGNISSETVLYPGTENLTSSVQDLITLGGYVDEMDNLTIPFLNWIGYINITQVVPCAEQFETQDECFGPVNPLLYRLDDMSETWRSWPWQTCTEWGYYSTGSGVPEGELGLISRLIDIPYLTTICSEAFSITTAPNVSYVNNYGGYNINYTRLAFVDGEYDVWRPATAHAQQFNSTAMNRTSSTDEPFILISEGGHHWDENGLFPNETTSELPPEPVKDAQSAEASFVLAWMQEWQEAQEERNAEKVTVQDGASGKGRGRHGKVLYNYDY